MAYWLRDIRCSGRSPAGVSLLAGVVDMMQRSCHGRWGRRRCDDLCHKNEGVIGHRRSISSAPVETVLRPLRSRKKREKYEYIPYVPPVPCPLYYAPPSFPPSGTPRCAQANRGLHGRRHAKLCRGPGKQSRRFPWAHANHRQVNRQTESPIGRKRAQWHTTVHVWCIHTVHSGVVFCFVF